MRPLGIEHISVFGLPPPDFIRLAADLGCQHISSGLRPLPYNPHGNPVWSLADDAALRRETEQAMAQTGVTISLGGGVSVAPDVDIRDRAGDLDLLCGLGIRLFNAISFERDRQRTLDQFGATCWRAAGPPPRWSSPPPRPSATWPPPARRCARSAGRTLG